MWVSHDVHQVTGVTTYMQARQDVGWCNGWDVVVAVQDDHTLSLQLYEGSVLVIPAHTLQVQAHRGKLDADAVLHFGDDGSDRGECCCIHDQNERVARGSLKQESSGLPDQWVTVVSRIHQRMHGRAGVQCACS